MDDRLRDAERRHRRAGGRLEDRAAWWTARLRAGDLPAGARALVDAFVAGRLTLDHLTLSAYLGEPRAQALALEDMVERVAYGGAEVAMRVALDDAEWGDDDLVAWIGELRLWDRRLVPRALVAVARALCDALGALDLSAGEDERDPTDAEYRQYSREQDLAWSRALLDRVDAWLDGAGPAAPLRSACAAWPHSTYWQPVLEAAAGAAGAALAVEDGPGPARTPRREWLRAAQALCVTPRALKGAIASSLLGRSGA